MHLVAESSELILLMSTNEEKLRFWNRGRWHFAVEWRGKLEASHAYKIRPIFNPIKPDFQIFVFVFVSFSIQSNLIYEIKFNFHRGKILSNGILSWFYLTMQWVIFVNSLFGYFFLRGTHFWSLRGRKKPTIPALLRPTSLQADDLRRSTQPLPWLVVPLSMLAYYPKICIWLFLFMCHHKQPIFKSRALYPLCLCQCFQLWSKRAVWARSRAAQRKLICLPGCLSPRTYIS